MTTNRLREMSDEALVTREVQKILACANPQPDIPASVRALRPASTTTTRPVVAPLSHRRYLVKVTIGEETHDKLERVRTLLRSNGEAAGGASDVDNLQLRCRSHNQHEVRLYFGDERSMRDDLPPLADRNSERA